MDDVRSLPRGFELVVTLLLESKHQVPFDEGPVTHSSTVIIAEALLVYS